MMVLYNSSACMPISYLLKREYLHSQATSRLAREACFSLTVSALLSLLSQVPLLPAGREPAACMSLCQSHWLLWGHTAEETTPPEALNCSCLSLWPKRRLLTHHWRALTPMEAKSGPALCILVAGSTGKIGFFFSHLFQGKGKQHDYCVILGKHTNKMQLWKDQILNGLSGWRRGCVRRP